MCANRRTNSTNNTPKATLPIVNSGRAGEIRTHDLLHPMKCAVRLEGLILLGCGAGVLMTVC
jgi:hypothetical protein